MSTIQNSRLMEFSDRIAAARGPAAWETLSKEIETTSLSQDAKHTLRELIAKRFEQELKLSQEISNPGCAR